MMGSEGARALSEALRFNTTLTALRLWGVQYKENINTHNKNSNAGNYLLDEGARALSEALKSNTTLATLDLQCVDHRQTL